MIKVPVDDGTVCCQSEHTWSGVAVLRFGGDGPDFDKAKAYFVQTVHRFSVLIEACSDPNGVFELQAQDVNSLHTSEDQRSFKRTRFCLETGR